MSKGYVEFFFSNAKYRRLWSASIISLLGEWFNTIALFFLILEYSGSEFLLGVLFSVRMFAFAISQPINGLLADRLNRKSLMLWSNVLQIGLALSFLLVDGKEDMWWLISISGLMMLLHGVYVTAERAALPNIVDEDDFLPHLTPYSIMKLGRVKLLPFSILFLTASKPSKTCILPAEYWSLF